MTESSAAITGPWRGGPAERGRHPQTPTVKLDERAIIDGDPENSTNGASARPSAKGGGGAPQFIARRLAEDLATKTPVASSAGGQLYVFRDGAYRPDGERDLRKRIAAHLGDDWKEARAKETIGYLRDTTPRLWPEPPRDLINLANGILDIDSGTLELHSPDFLSPVQVPVAYDTNAKCPAIERFLADVLAPELAGLVYEIAGYLVPPDQSLQTAVMLLGDGANGKSTLLGILTALVAGGFWVSNHLDQVPRLLAIAPWLVVFGAIFKGGLAAVGFRAAMRRRGRARSARFPPWRGSWW